MDQLGRHSVARSPGQRPGFRRWLRQYGRSGSMWWVEDLPGLECHDGDLPLVDDGEDTTTALGRPDPEVMQAAGPA